MGCKPQNSRCESRRASRRELCRQESRCPDLELLRAVAEEPSQFDDQRLRDLAVPGQLDYHLNPLNSYAELPHERVYAAQLRLRF